ncbi:MAG: GGDEF domain-containing protein [Synergistaceae bacterium]|jgi:diguanylate cyclase (GGDEF)-like protein|nr:GGDEF domain-containing protein [Synergistaceae bacterium]
MIALEKSRLHQITVVVISGFFVIVLAIVISMSIKNTADLRRILEDSVKSQLISISVAAREIVDSDKFDAYNTLEDTKIDGAAYAKTLEDLRSLQKKVGAQYIYALKQLGDKYYFVFDTDTEDETRFTEYELASVHEQAFLGQDSAGIMNVVDEWGSYNTGAVPLRKDDRIVGIICTDIADTFLKQNAGTARVNSIFLVGAIGLTMSVMLLIVLTLTRRVQHMQEKLYRMANYDAVTGLPNRQYLMDYLQRISSDGNGSKTPFALLFIDLDNFKKVNDGAGHDAGDELLRNIGGCLDGAHENSKAFRPSPGILNVSARIGGDEFVQIVPGVATEAEAADAGQRALDSFGSQSKFDRFIEKYGVGLSIGVALFPYHTSNYNVLIKYADIAMYQAKQGGKNSYRVYADEMGQEEVQPGPR